MRISVSILIILGFSSNLAFATTLQDDRRIEENKRIKLKPTEAKYYSRPKADVDQKKMTVREYMNQLATKESVDCADAGFIIALLLGNNEELNDFESQKAFLIDRGFIPSRLKEDFNAERKVHRGLMAYMLQKALGIKGGLTLRILRSNERYAHQELVYEGIMVSGSAKEYMTGQELVYTFVQAVNYLSKK